ncbi:MAG: DUF1189 domain-containing protein [Coprobacillus sp.]|nr:DUF1189 domain-containing protein [Coprobacillus sp.]MDY4144880.1 DUF1189 family protein [Bacilli bacterium]
MKIIKRLMDGLFSPGKIYYYKDDKKILTTIYFFILVLIYAIPMTIGVVFSSNLSTNFMEEVRTAFQMSEVIPYKIENNKLTYISDGENIEKSYYVISTTNYDIYFSSSKTLPDTVNRTTSFSITKTRILFTIDGVYEYRNYPTLLVTYDKYNLNGIDFSKAKENDYKYWENIFTNLSSIINTYKNQTMWITIVSLVLISSGGLALLSLIVTIFGRFSKGNTLKFSKYWQMSIYLVTPMVFGELFATLYSMQVFYYIGLIMTLIYSMTFNQVCGKGDI